MMRREMTTTTSTIRYPSTVCRIAPYAVLVLCMSHSTIRYPSTAPDAAKRQTLCYASTAYRLAAQNCTLQY
eukprot:2618986-Rhodomonas_salina.1